MSSIDLRSDTVTRPTEAMLAAMMAAPTGDDVYGEDPTVNRLQDVLAERFGHEAGLFCPSGTMANQMAINVHTQPGDEVVCHRLSHIYNYEGGGIARNSGASVRLVHAPRGAMPAEAIRSEVNPADSHFARTALVCVEDTVNKGGGAVQAQADLEAGSTACRDLGLPVPLDGARWPEHTASPPTSTVPACGTPPWRSALTAPRSPPHSTRCRCVSRRDSEPRWGPFCSEAGLSSRKPTGLGR